MKNVTIVLAVAAVLALVGPANAALYETGFETGDGFSDGTSVAGIDGWVVDGGTCITEEDGHISGSMSLQVQGDKSYCTVSFTNTTAWTVTSEFKTKGDTDGKKWYFYLIGGNKRATRVLFGDDGKIYAASGNVDQVLKNGAADMTWDKDTVYSVKMVADATTGVETYDVYIDGVQGCDDLNFYETTGGNRLTGFRVLGYGAGTTKFVDDLSIIPEPATLVLLGLGGLGVLIRRRRK